MEAILVKVFATVLALSLVTTNPDAVKVHFDPVADRAEVLRILSDGCTSIRKEFDIDNIDLDDLLATVMTDRQAVEGEIAAFKGIKFTDLHLAYKQLCKKERLAKPVVDIGQVIEFYNQATIDLPDHTRLRGLRLPGMTAVLDDGGTKFAELFEPEHRRQWVPLSEIPELVQQAFIAAEDKRFFQHRGVDERSVIRAFINMVAEPNRREGGSTITQQVAKNLLVGDAITYERKIREMIVATRVEKVISKQEILEIYLNSIFLGRSSWGIELAARAYFGKRARDLTLTEGAFLAGLTKGPNYYNPDRNRERAQGRLAYVLSRMNEDGLISADEMKRAESIRLPIVAHSRTQRDTGFHFVDQISREAKAVAGINSLTAASYTVRSTLRPQLQRAAEAALQEGLAQYEQNAGRVRFQSAEGNIGEAIRRLGADPNADRSRPVWLQALKQVRMPLYDVHWATAVVVERAALNGGNVSIRVGLRDGRILPLSTESTTARRNLAVNDVIYVKVVEPVGRDGGTRVEQRTRPMVQGATVVIENKTGRVLAMVGGFSFPLSQLNRVTQSRRQPGSSLKPITYLAALNRGMQPNALVKDAPITLQPIGGINRYTRAEDWWSPRNYDGRYAGTMTLRRALEQSKNLVTARLLDGGVAASAPESLDIVCRLAVEAQLYQQCERFYPFVLGAQPVRPINLAAFYAAVANEGARPTPHLIESIEQDGKTVYHDRPTMTWIGSADRASFYQLKTILQGVVARGTAARISAQSPYVAGKTGTSDEWNDAWFVGFSNDVTVAVWVGYDNAKGKRTLGSGQTGSSVALPIFDRIMQAVWALYAPKTELAGPSAEAAEHLVALPINVRNGTRLAKRSRDGFMEYFKIDVDGRAADSPERLVSRGDRYSDDKDRRRPRGFRHFARGRDYATPDGGQQRRDSPPTFFLPFFGGGFDDRQQQESRAQRLPQRSVPQQQGRRQRYTEPPEYQERRRRNDDFFFGSRGGGF